MVATPKKRNIEEDKYCQDCKFQKNNPSYCSRFEKFTARKKTCDEWRRK